MSVEQIVLFLVGVVAGHVLMTMWLTRGRGK